MNVIVNTKGNSERTMKRLMYVLDFVNSHPIVPDDVNFVIQEESRKSINYGDRNIGKKTIKKDKKFFEHNEIDGHCMHLSKFDFKGAKMFYLTKYNEEVLNGDKSYLPFDIFENIFFHISRYEEYFCSHDKIDIHGRMMSETQILVREGLEKQPIVDTLVFGLLIFCNIKPVKLIERIFLSHDIDSVKRFRNTRDLIRGIGGIIYRQESVKRIVKLVKSFNKEKDPYDVFSWMLLGDSSYKKCIYLLVGGKHKTDTWHDLNFQEVTRIKTIADENGYEIGLHPSYFSCSEFSIFNSEKEKLENWLNKPVVQSRQHFLNFSWPKTPELIDQLEILEDSTLGYSDKIGYRCGTAFPYHLYNYKREKAYKFMEYPLICMDIALLREANYKKETVIELLNSIHKSSPWKSYNFHNSTFFDGWMNNIPLKEMYLNHFSKK